MVLKKKRCKHCRKIFFKETCHNYAYKYCSKKCCGAEHYLRAKIKKLKKYPKIPKICKQCGKKFIHGKRGCKGIVYCSNECNKLFHQMEKEKQIEMKKEYRECPVCKNQFLITNINDIYCSHDCREKFYGEKYLKEWATRVPKKRKPRDLKQIMFHDLGDKPSDSSLKRFRACRG